jgi:hypothetical protein
MNKNNGQLTWPTVYFIVYVDLFLSVILGYPHLSACQNPGKLANVRAAVTPTAARARPLSLSERLLFGCWSAKYNSACAPLHESAWLASAE